jgi:hypothetical protein
MADSTADFTKLVPGFDFLQGLVKNAGAALPNIGQWVAPTLDPDELEKRIEELRTVQFWLEQNAKMLGATIQALEVQRMTLSTLKTMNVQMSDLRDSMRLPERPTAAAAPAPSAAPTPAPAPAKATKKSSGTPKPSPAGATAPAGVVDPMQWWGALTKQFTQLAAEAIKDSARTVPKVPAGAPVKSDGAAARTPKAEKAPKKKTAKAKTKAAGTAANASGSRGDARGTKTPT